MYLGADSTPERLNRFMAQRHILHVLKDVKPQARRALLLSADDDLMKIVECATNTLNGKKIIKDEKSKLIKNKNRLGC